MKLSEMLERAAKLFSGFTLRNGLYVPKDRVPEVMLFLDDAKLERCSGRVLSAIVMPKKYFEGRFKAEAGRILTRLGKDAKEFKGSKLSEGNLPNYREFLSAVTYGISLLSQRSAIRSVVCTIAEGVRKSPRMVEVQKFIEDVWRDATSSISPTASMELANQVMWLGSIGEKIFPQRYQVTVHVRVDNEGLLRDTINPIRAYMSPAGHALLGRGDNLFTTTFAVIRKKLPSWHMIPNFGTWEYIDSHTDFGIQAADLVSSLFQGALRHILGDPSGSSRIKYELLKEIAPSFELPPELATDIELVQLPDLQYGLRCTNQELVSHYTLEP